MLIYLLGFFNINQKIKKVKLLIIVLCGLTPQHIFNKNEIKLL